MKTKGWGKGRVKEENENESKKKIKVIYLPSIKKNDALLNYQQTEE